MVVTRGAAERERVESCPGRIEREIRNDDIHGKDRNMTYEIADAFLRSVADHVHEGAKEDNGPRS